MDIPLAPYRVLDLCDEKGLLCSRILGDLGADVIKVEKPGGDSSRDIGPFYKDIVNPEKSLYWFFYNFNKRGITLNLECSDGQKILKKLIEKTDFLIESYPPGFLDTLNLGYTSLKKINPRLVMTSISPFGQSGPYRDFKTSDLIAAASGGLLYICGDSDRAPVRISAEQSYAQAGAQAAAASLIAHYHRQITGEGQLVDVSIQECMMWTQSHTIPSWDRKKIMQVRMGSWLQRLGARVRQIYPCKDGDVCVGINVSKIMAPAMANLVKVMNMEGYGEELKGVAWEEIEEKGLAQEDHDRWEKALEEYLLQHTMSELQDLALKYDLMLSPINTPRDVINHPHLKARDYWTNVNHPDLGAQITYPGAYFKSTETSWVGMRRAPLIGEHNNEIYNNELGFSVEQVNLLKQANVI